MRTVTSFLALCVTLIGCAPANQADYAPIEIPPETPQEPAPETEPGRGENDVTMDAWQLRALPHREPSFPYLEGEDTTISRSVGNVSFGHLVSARAM